MLNSERDSFVRTANRISGWEKININVLCNLYLDETNEYLKEGYLSAIILHYWGYIGVYYSRGKKCGFPIEDCYDWLLEGVLYVLDKHVWRDENSALYGDINAPDKCMHRVISSREKIAYYNANLLKNKINYGSNRMSLDELMENVSDHLVQFEDRDVSENFDRYIGLSSIINSYFKQGKYISTIIMYSLSADNSTFSSEGNFHISKLIEFIKKADDNVVNCMAEDINLDSCECTTLKSRINKLKNCSEQVLYKVIRKSLEELSKDKVLKESLCF